MPNSNFIIENIINFIPSVLLYAELHFRFKWSRSSYYQREPEILADLPYRVEPSTAIPILLLIKDSHQFPITLRDVKVSIYKSIELLKTTMIKYNTSITSRFWDETVFIESGNISGTVDIVVEFNYLINGVEKKCFTHNFPQSKFHKLTTYLSNHSFPNDGKVQYGDLHYHTNLTEDMVEFGAPLKATLFAAQSIGLDFFCNTDHSYDLDDMPGSWKETDPTLEKWNNSRNEIDSLNNEFADSSFIIPSEELSLHNLDGRNIHALILNNSDFLPGSGDSAEKPFNFTSEYNTQNVNEGLEKDALCIAAHPFNPVPILQWFFFKRGKWKLNDVLQNNIAGLQILNGAIDTGFNEGMKFWINILLKGHHKYIYAGNDAHGNFNIYRQIKIPMVSLYEKKEQIFGQFRTGVYPTKKNDISTIIKSLKNGNCFVTNAPLLNMTFHSDSSIYAMGSVANVDNGILNISIISTSEFGKIKKIVIKKGVIGEKKEIDYFSIINPKMYELNKSIEIYADSKCYYRCEVELEFLGGNKKFALTNPIWLFPNIMEDVLN